MGMAASQARLLSITARLNNIELQSQNISNAKLRLADSTDAASDKYVKALNKTHYLYNTYNATGDVVSTALTGASLTNYGELKNQYGLVNTAGQILVSERDAANFENSNTLEEFLDKYGVLADISEGITIEYVNPVWIDTQAEYEAKLEEWQTNMPNNNDPKYTREYWSPMTPEEYEKVHDEWATEQPNPDDEKYNTITETSDDSIYKKFTEGAAGGCYTQSINPCSIGYLATIHLYDTLVHMLDVGTHTTSTGETFTVNDFDESYASHPGGYWWEEGMQSENINNVGGSPAIMAEIREAIRGKYCCGDSHDVNDETHYQDCPTSWGGCGGKHELDCETTTPCSDKQLITDKIEDLYYAFATMFENGITKLDLNNPQHVELFNQTIHLVEHDLKVALEEKKFDQEAYDADVADWQNREPQQPELVKEFDQDAYDADVAKWEAEKPIEDTNIQKYLPKTVRVATDLDEAQWYVNLWNRMNGVSNFKGGFGNNGAYDPDAGWASKSTTEQSWAVLKDGDMNSPEYLKYAIENGLITLEQVQFTEISSSEQGVKNAEWTSIVFTNAQDIIEVKDEVAISKAEVEYNKTLKELEIKDKQYDTDLKKLDTEHSALQTEYDSIKTVIDKNVQRSFKVFS